MIYHRMNKYHSQALYTNSIYLVASNVLNAGFGLVFWVVSARLYTIEDVGNATAIISSIGLVALISKLGFDASIIRFFPSEDKNKVLNTTLIVTTSASIIFGFIYILFLEYITPTLTFIKTPTYLCIFLLIIAVDSISSITGRAFVAARNSDYYFIQNLLMVLRVPLLIPLLFLGPFGIVCSMGVAYLSASIMAILILKKCFLKIRLEIDKEFIYKSLEFSIGNYISSILSLAPTLLMPIIVLKMLGEIDAAKYSIAYAIGNIVLIIPSALSTSLFVEGSYGENLRIMATKAGMASFALLMPSVIFLWIFGADILSFLKNDYLGALDLFRIFAISSFLVALYLIATTILNIKMRVGEIAQLNFIKLILLIVLSYTLIKSYGVIGTGYGWMATYVVLDLLIIIKVIYQWLHK